MIRQENIVPLWKSIPLSTCPHPPLRCGRYARRFARSKFHTIVIPAQDDDTCAAERSTAAFVSRRPVTIKR